MLNLRPLALSPLLLLSHNIYLIVLSLFLIGGGFSIAFPYVEAIAIEKLGNHYGKSRLFGSIGFIVVGISFSYFNINPVFLEFTGSIIAVGLFSKHLFLYESMFAMAGFIILVYGSSKIKK